MKLLKSSLFILLLLYSLKAICQESHYYTAQSPKKPFIGITAFQTMCLIENSNRQCKEVCSLLTFQEKDNQWTANIEDVDKNGKEIVSIQILDCTIKSNREYVFRVSDGDNTSKMTLLLSPNECSLNLILDSNSSLFFTSLGNNEELTFMVKTVNSTHF